jgi:hypothetical protein
LETKLFYAQTIKKKNTIHHKAKTLFFKQINVVGVGQRHTGYFCKTGGNKQTLGFTSDMLMSDWGGGRD